MNPINTERTLIGVWRQRLAAGGLSPYTVKCLREAIARAERNLALFKSREKTMKGK